MELGAPNEKKFSKILEILFLFQSFLKASLCNYKLICSAFLAENLGRRKFLRNRI